MDPEREIIEAESKIPETTTVEQADSDTNTMEVVTDSTPTVPQSQATTQDQSTLGASRQHSQNSQQPQANAGRPTRELKVEDALLYLDQVKCEFSDKPHVYNEFLEIMKNFKSQAINTPGVISRVKSLFKGYNKLILGFNTFLPEGEGYKIEITPEDEEAEKNMNNGSAQAQLGSTAAGSASTDAAQDNSGAFKPQAMQQQHAISYVTQIRNRFANEPETYRAFLKILHTYQKEQKGIKDVLEQVSQLFADHPDLLMEFTYFLPDAVQEQAKERLQRAATESEVRKKQRLLVASQNQSGSFAGQVDSDMPPLKKQAKERGIDKEGKQKTGVPGPKKASKKKGYSETTSTLRDFDGIGNQSISSERKFFDHVKELFTTTSRDAWSEFVKCLELYSHDAISKKDMMQLIQGLFGPSNIDLFEEFRSLLNHRAAYDSSAQDMWFAIPLSEIEFSQCRKCTPSYRALPKDYPRPQCSERTLADMAVLSDDWVSIPIGSEEAYSFKHMQKNQFDEALYRCEDERFEIDMVIDSNMSTIKVLEPIAEEIMNLKVLEDEGRSSKFSFQLDKRNLGVVHLNSIARLYGEHGAEILELLHKNPAGSIPIIVKRLKQKDLEWRKARQELNKAWKEVVEKNFEKSLDHRSFSFKQQDKRFYTIRNLLTDINGGVTEAGVSAEDLLKAPGIILSLPPEITPLLADMTPQLNLAYDSSNMGVFQDIYRIICHSIESSGVSNPDKERITGLWRDFLRVFFNLPVQFLYGSNLSLPAASVDATLGIDSDSAPTGDSDAVPVDKSMSWAVGTNVLTLFGSGTITGFREFDNMYQVHLAFGVAYVRPSTILGAEELTANALEAIGVTIDSQGNEFINNVLLKPEKTKQSSILPDPCKVFFGTQMSYIFMRLHHTLFWRLVQVKRLASEWQNKGVSQKKHPMSMFDDSDDEGDVLNHIGATKPLYSSFLSQLYALLDGSIDNAKYDDVCRQLLTNKAYFVCTLDKIVQQIVKCLQSMSNDENFTRLIGIFMYHHKSSRGVDTTAYQHHVASFCGDDIYRLQLMTRSIHNISEPIIISCQYLGALQSGSLYPPSAEKLSKTSSVEDQDTNGAMDTV